MATAHQIRDLITETTTGTVPPRVPREVREEVYCYAVRRREQEAPWAVIARYVIGSIFEITVTVIDDDTGAVIAMATATVLDPAIEVPTLGQLGIGVLIPLLSLAALVVLRRSGS